MVVFDATTLLLLMSPDIPPPIDPMTHIPVEHAKERLDYLVLELERNRTKIIVPTPALSEILVRAASAGPAYLDRLSSSAAFRVAPFDQRAAVEVAAMTRAAIASGDKRGGAEGTWAKVKYDRQIVAIAKVEGATTIYSDDTDVRRIASEVHIRVISISELPLPPEAAQRNIDFERPRDPEDC
jgi:predicted nucleic acid-binding protein